MGLKEEVLQKIKNNKYIGDDYLSWEFNNLYSYSGELGCIYSKEKTVFKLWSPIAEKVVINFYDDATKEEAYEHRDMILGGKGVWYSQVFGDIKDKFYTYSIIINELENEVIDPYAKAVTTNGKRAMIINLDETNPNDWKCDEKPKLNNQTDSIIYELHVRDFSISNNSGIKNKGKFLAFTEESTISEEGEMTGISHLKELGITHIHLLPIFDFGSIYENKIDEMQYNWGYDPENYNVPEGSYATDPNNPKTRIIELKEAIKTLHKNGIRVIMDVVYNHTFKSYSTNFHKIMPFYYHRQNFNGSFSNGSGCGNETASERSMVRKFIIDSIIYWVKEYHIDGFRFDLMAIHDVETMNKIKEELDKIDSSIIVYGEGWNGGNSMLEDSKRASKFNGYKLNSKIALFNDDSRDGIKGNVFNKHETGFVNGGYDFKETVKLGIVGAVYHPQIDYSKIIYSNKPWATQPTQTINYVSAHDNLTLWDKVSITGEKLSENEKIKMDKLSNGIVLTSQGIPFIQAGEEFLRTKYSNDNSYNAPDDINQLKWDRKSKYKEVFNYYKELINIRKRHPAFRMKTRDDIQNNLTFLNINENNLIAYIIKCDDIEENWKEILIVLNGNNKVKFIDIPKGIWNVVVDENRASEEIIRIIDEEKLQINPISMMILVKEDN